jgi:NAD(P)-dependent dehydrogenase (short-subunit alcohol dehydrogenase family)
VRFDLTGRVALVTGSSRGIGRAIAFALADAGAAVILHGRASSRELDAAIVDVARRSSATCVFGDLTAVHTARRVVDDAAAWRGRLDILVNNAGAVIPTPADDITELLWDAMININVRAAFFCAQAASLHMRQNSFGRIVNISSAAAEAAIPTYTHYGAAKAALNAVTRNLALEWAPHGITVNTVSPAFIRTDLTEVVFRQNPSLYDDQLSRVLIRRMGEPDEVAGAVVYLASNEASYTTGETIHADGGYLVQ